MSSTAEGELPLPAPPAAPLLVPLSEAAWQRAGDNHMLVGHVRVHAMDAAQNKAKALPPRVRARPLRGQAAKARASHRARRRRRGRGAARPAAGAGQSQGEAGKPAGWETTKKIKNGALEVGRAPARVLCFLQRHVVCLRMSQHPNGTHLKPAVAGRVGRVPNQQEASQTESQDLHPLSCTTGGSDGSWGGLDSLSQRRRSVHCRPLNPPTFSLPNWNVLPTTLVCSMHK